MRFEIYEDESASARNNVRWRLKAKNGKIVAVSGEAFHSVGNARRNIKDWRTQVICAEVCTMQKIVVLDMPQAKEKK